uniref:Uncharacterized protein n=1 Tax=Caenorhabditis tropicalis TaxID=1561998 RepID=A0A1I7UB10_9PELO
MEDEEPPSTSTSSESPEAILKAPTSSTRRRKATKRGEIVCYDTKEKRVLILQSRSQTVQFLVSDSFRDFRVASRSTPFNTVYHLEENTDLMITTMKFNH